MLVKRRWDELVQGDAVYLPWYKLVSTYLGHVGEGDNRQRPAVFNPNTQDALYCPDHIPVMRFEGVVPYHVNVRGVQTNEVLWRKVD